MYTVLNTKIRKSRKQLETKISAERVRELVFCEICTDWTVTSKTRMLYAVTDSRLYHIFLSYYIM